MFLGGIARKGAPLWSEEDRNYALAWRQYEAGLHSCGQPMSESLDPKNQFGYKAETIRCFACAPMDKVLSEAEDRNGLRARLTMTPHGPV